MISEICTWNLGNHLLIHMWCDISSSFWSERWGSVGFFFHAPNKLSKVKITQLSVRNAVVRDHYTFMRLCVCVCECVNCWLDRYMSKRACHTITDYLNENHWQVRRVITERARTRINEAAMQNWICKKHIYFLSCPFASFLPPFFFSLPLHLSSIAFLCTLSLLPTLSLNWLLLISLRLS